MPEDGDRHDELLRRYLEQIADEPLLGVDEERELARAARAGDKASEQALVRSNLRLVVTMAKRYEGAGVPLLDLIQEGNLGLLQAVEAFDADRGFAFRTFATWWIRQAIARNIREEGSAITLRASGIRPVTDPLQDAWDAFVAHHGRQPTMSELAADVGLSEQQVADLLGPPPPPIAD